MRYRKLNTNGDYTFGQAQSNFYVNTPEAVAQAVKTRLLLIQGEWFLDVSEGTPYSAKILGAGKVATLVQLLNGLLLKHRASKKLLGLGLFLILLHVKLQLRLQLTQYTAK